MKMKKTVLAQLITGIYAGISGGVAWADSGEAMRLEEVSVTATREARATRDVPASITVVGKQQIEDSKMFNIKDALMGVPGVLIDSKNGGYDARLIIRGAGLKANYGIREINVLRDGVPITDPDSFTRLDFIDTQDIERIEVTKGPGNIYSPGSTGGAIQIISKSVFDERANVARIGVGEQGSQNYHLRLGGMVNANNALALTVSRRSQDNDWRSWNEFDTTQFGLKHGMLLGGNATWESELSYSEANLQLPGSMSEAQFETFKQTGEQRVTQDPWKHSGRYSQIWFFNTKYEKEAGAWTFKPRFYFNQWKHYHPVTGIINETGDWTRIFGTDLEAHYRHDLLGAKANLVAGVTLRQDGNDDSRKYQYKDVVVAGGRIVSTLSDAKGALASIQKSTTRLRGIFLQESLQPTSRLLIDAGLRFDKSSLDFDETAFSKFDYTAGKYVTNPSPVLTSVNKTYNLFSPRLAATYRLTNWINLYGSVAQGNQVPSDSETTSNPNLNAARSRNYEIGLKGRANRWSFDTAVYVNSVEDEIVQVRQPDGQTVFQNAGKTDKKGFEFSGGYNLMPGLEVGASYAFSSYKYDSFTEPVRVGAVTTNVDRAGKRLPYVPMHQYSLFASYRHASGFRMRIQTSTWGRYFLDNANSESYDGYAWLTTVSLGYEKNRHSLTLTADNVFDDKYAVEVKKDTSGKKSYSAGSPRVVMLNYAYRF
jgi:iron complex outermembrane receptor protein